MDTAAPQPRPVSGSLLGETFLAAVIGADWTGESQSVLGQQFGVPLPPLTPVGCQGLSKLTMGIRGYSF